MVLTVFFVISFPPCVPPYHPRLTSSWRMFLNRSTTPRDSATDIEKTSQKGVPERERPNRSVVKSTDFGEKFSGIFKYIYKEKILVEISENYRKILKELRTNYWKTWK